MDHPVADAVSVLITATKDKKREATIILGMQCKIIIVMYDDELEFDSDQLGKQIFDWEDVEELRSRYDQQIRFANGKVKRGFLIILSDIKFIQKCPATCYLISTIRGVSET